MLVARDIWFRYRDKEVLKGVSLEHSCGIGCLLGPNGAGKTTLLRVITGVLQPQRGVVELNGTRITELGFIERAKLISYVPQEFTVKFPYNVIDIVLMGRNPYINPLRGPDKHDEEKAWKALETLGIEALAYKPFTYLSGGEKRLVLIARALAQESKLMLLDEPTSFLDFKNKHRILKLIRKIARESGKTVLITLHDPNLAYMYCDKVFLMKEGRIYYSGIPKDTITAENISKIYGIPVRSIEIDGIRIMLPLEQLAIDVTKYISI